MYKVDLDADVEELKLNEYTLEHVRAFGMYNHLHLDPWYEDSVLFVDGRGRVLSFTVILTVLWSRAGGSSRWGPNAVIEPQHQPPLLGDAQRKALPKRWNIKDVFVTEQVHFIRLHQVTQET
eukprot:XP_011615214.1 PREDICTED: nudC domain-containing protein 1 [Takifugu rubripes]